MRNHHASSILIGDYLYGFSDAILTAMKFDTGEVAWRDRSVGKGSVVFADDRLYLYSEQGVVGLAEANPAGYREHGRFQIQTGNLPTWSHPDRLERQALHSRSGHYLRATTCARNDDVELALQAQLSGPILKVGLHLTRIRTQSGP